MIKVLVKELQSDVNVNPPPPISQTTRAVSPEETILYIFTAWKAECGGEIKQTKTEHPCPHDI